MILSHPKKILLIVAMEQEAKLVIDQLGFKELEQTRSRLPFKRYQSKLGTLDLTLSLNGKDDRFGNQNVGLEVAALNAYDSIRQFSPDLVLNFGTAGSFRHRGGEIGKVFLSKNRFHFHDHRIPLAGYEEYGRGGFPGLDVEEFAKHLGYETGLVSSGSSLDFTQEDLNELELSQAALKEMEAASIAWSCYLSQVPFFALKSVTDLVEKDISSAVEFEKNFHIAVESLTKAVIKVLKGIDEEKLKWE